MTNQKNKKRIAVITAVFAVAVLNLGFGFGFAEKANAGVIFEENFDSVADWQSAQTQSKYDGCGGSDVVWYSNTCADPAACPPSTSWPTDVDGMWDGAYFSSDVDCDGPVNELFIINSSYGRSGKGLREKVQGDGYGNWHGGRLGLKLPVPQDELYFRMWAKFDAGFTWGADSHGQQKFCDVFSFPPNWPINGSPDMFTRFSAGFNQPGVIFVWYSNRSYDSQYQARLQGAERYSSKYESYDSAIADLWPSDGEWHSYEFRVKINSAPDVEDGDWDFWIDGIKVMSRSDIAWTRRNNWQSGYSYTAYSASSPVYSFLTPSAARKGFMAKTNHTSGGSEPNWDDAVNIGDEVSDGNGNIWVLMTFFKWNNFSLFDNHYLGIDTGYIDEFVQYDDIVISNSYIGPDYIIGGATPDTTPPLVTNFSLPSTSTSLIVPITEFTATDNTAVTGYKLTETSDTPTAEESGWESSPQTSYTFLTGGIKTLYAWAKDAQGNISSSRSGSVTINLSTYTLTNFISAITNWLQIGNETSDVNSDGVVNTRDLGVMMSSWEN